MLKDFASYVIYSLIRHEKGYQLGGAVEFDIYNMIKMLLLLSVLIFIILIIKSYFSSEKSEKMLIHKKRFIYNILTALLKVVIPFCSCSSVSLFIGFVEAGVPLGVTFSFLISSPMVNEVALSCSEAFLLEGDSNIYGHRTSDCSLKI